MNKKLAKGLAIALSASMFIGVIGCASQEGENQAISSASAASVAPENKTTFSDFDEFVNGEWKKSMSEANSGTVYSLDDEAALMHDRIEKILTDTDLDKLSEDDGLYKVVSFYRQFLDTSDYDKRYETVREHLAKVEQAKTLEDFYELYGNEEYAFLNSLFRFNVNADENGYTSLSFSPDSFAEGANYYYNLVTNPSEELQDTRKEYLLMLEKLGYSEDRVETMLLNSTKLGEMIEEYRNVEGDLRMFERATLEDQNVSVPVIDILVNLHAFGKKRRFYARDNFASFLNEIYQPQNIEMIRDHFLLTSISKLIPLIGEDEVKAEYGMDYPQIAYSILTTLAPDVINQEYQELYVEEGKLEEAAALTDEIKDVMRSLISDADWLTPHGKELAKHKLLTMRASFGLNGTGNYFEDVELSDNTVENYLNMLVSNQRFFRKQTSKDDEQRDIFDANLYEINGRYFYNNNAFIVTNGMLGSDRLKKSDAYEETLALLGVCIAHEISHSFAPYGIDYNYHAYYEPWLEADEKAVYDEKAQAVTEFFDGLEIEYGEKIDGKLVMDEAFTDILSIECCLKLLEQQENPDYDLFFRTYATDHAYFYTQEGAAKAVKDTHLPAKQRINYVLGQFDKFYEVYEVDETSPFFVPKEKRIRIFSK